MITKETKIIKVNPEGIPDFLKALPYWINWKPVFIDGKAKKLPTYSEAVLRGQYWETAGRELLREKISVSFLMLPGLPHICDRVSFARHNIA